MSQHVVKGVAHLVGTLLDLQLLPVDLVLDVVDPVIQLSDVHLAVLEPVHGKPVKVGFSNSRVETRTVKAHAN